MKTILSIVFMLVTQHLAGQQVVRGGQPHSGRLSWNDFSANLPEHAKWDANTACKVIPAVKHKRQPDGKYVAESVSVTVEMDTSRTWARLSKRTDRLLQHEQGHLDIFILCARHMKAAISSASFSQENLDAGLKQLISRTMEQYNALHKRYDKETGYSANSKPQAQWTQWLNDQIKGGSYSPAGPRYE